MAVYGKSWMLLVDGTRCNGCMCEILHVYVLSVYGNSWVFMVDGTR